MHRKCLNCQVFLVDRHKIKFCSNRCQTDFKYREYIKLWKGGNSLLPISKNISGHIRRYLFTKYNNMCSRCLWNEINPITKQIPLEVDHIDGNAENNFELNLRLLCPNCHSLTPCFRNLNKGNGRSWRKNKYIKNIIS